MFVSPSLKYRMRSTSLWRGRSGLEKVLLVCLSFLLLLCCTFIVVLVLIKQDTNMNINFLHPEPPEKCNKSQGAAPACLSRDCVVVAAEIIKSADFTADPCQDFYQFACGGWIRSNPIPDGKSSWNTFKKLWQNNQNTMRNILERNLTGADSECGACLKARQYYDSCLDTNGTLEQLGGRPLLQLLQHFYWNITDFDGGAQMESWRLQNVTERLQHGYNVGGFFVWNVGEDDKNSSRHVLQLDQGGLSLTTRDQYLNKTYEDDPVLEALLHVMVQTSLMLYKEKNKHDNLEDIPDIIQADITRQMKEVIDLETELAAI